MPMHGGDSQIDSNFSQSLKHIDNMFYERSAPRSMTGHFNSPAPPIWQLSPIPCLIPLHPKTILFADPMGEFSQHTSLFLVSFLSASSNHLSLNLRPSVSILYHCFPKWATLPPQGHWKDPGTDPLLECGYPGGVLSTSFF
ncbi:UNVERIFIED_CONTAM: hypothetical protein K2H54_048297 [Gekko kuhli]